MAHQLVPARLPVLGLGFLMPAPGPLGRLVRRRRSEMGLTQPELSDLTAQHGERVPQNMISRLESGKSQRVNSADRLASLAKALDFESNEDFLLAAYGPKDWTHPLDREPDHVVRGPEGELIALVRERPVHQQKAAVDVLRSFFATLDIIA